MTLRQFFKSNAFKSLAVLIAIVLVAGVLLAVFNDLLYISDEERLARTLSNIYGKDVTANALDIDEEERESAYGTVDAVYHIAQDGNYLFQTTGEGGYSGGSVTLWTVLACTGSREYGNLALAGIEKVVYDSNRSQTLMSNFNSAYYAYFTEHDDLVAAGGTFTAIKDGTDELNHVSTGATRTSTAVCNAVNAALFYFRANIASPIETSEDLSVVYGEEVTAYPVALTDAQKSYENGSVDSAYYVATHGHYLFRTTGTGGFKNGTVTVWTALTCTGSREGGDLTLTGIDRVVYASSVSQSYIDRVPESFYAYFAEQNALVAAGGTFTAIKDGTGELNNITTGASRSSNAACNAVNTALACFRTVLSGGAA